MRSAREFAQIETTFDNIDGNLKKMQLIAIHLQYQQESMLKSVEAMGEIVEQTVALEKKFFPRNPE